MKALLLILCLSISGLLLGQKVVIYTPTAQQILESGNTIAWYDAFDLSTITKNASDTVSRWNDKLGSGNDFVSGSCLWDTDRGMTFNGITQYLKTAVLDIDQPLMIYAVIRQRTWSEGKFIFDGNTIYSSTLYQTGGIENNFIRARAGAASAVNNALGMDSWSVVRLLFNGANSFLKIDDNVVINVTSQGPTTGDFGALSCNGFTIAAPGNLTPGYNANIDVQTLILCNEVHSSTNEEVINSYLKDNYMSKYRFDRGKMLIGWDGDYDDILLGHDLMVANGFTKGTAYLCTEGMVETGPNGNLTWDEIAIMVGEGMEVQDHGYTHPKFNELTEQELIDNLAAMAANITAHGYPPPKHLAYPYGYSDSLAREVVSRTLQTGRGVREVQLLGTVTDKYDLPAIGLGNLTSTPAGVQLIKDQIDYAVKNRTALILYCHGVDPDSGQSPEAFVEILQYAVASGIEFINMSELYSLLDP